MKTKTEMIEELSRTKMLKGQCRLSNRTTEEIKELYDEAVEIGEIQTSVPEKLRKEIEDLIMGKGNPEMFFRERVRDEFREMSK